MTTQTFEIDGMTCGHCMQRVQDALRGIAGVTVEQVRVGAARVRYDETTLDPSVIAQAIEGAGYRVLQAR